MISARERLLHQGRSSSAERVKVAGKNSVLVLGAPDRLDVSNRFELRERVLSALDCGVRAIVVDLSPTDYVDSAGLGTLVLLTKRARESGGRIVLSGLNDRVLDLLRLTRLDQVLEQAATLDEGRRLALA